MFIKEHHLWCPVRVSDEG